MGAEACRRAQGGQDPLTVRSPDITLVMWVWVSKRMQWNRLQQSAALTLIQGTQVRSMSAGCSSEAGIHGVCRPALGGAPGPAAGPAGTSPGLRSGEGAHYFQGGGNGAAPSEETGMLPSVCVRVRVCVCACRLPFRIACGKSENAKFTLYSTDINLRFCMSSPPPQCVVKLNALPVLPIMSCVCTHYGVSCYAMLCELHYNLCSLSADICYCGMWYVVLRCAVLRCVTVCIGLSVQHDQMPSCLAILTCQHDGAGQGSRHPRPCQRRNTKP